MCLRRIDSERVDPIRYTYTGPTIPKVQNTISRKTLDASSSEQYFKSSPGLINVNNTLPVTHRNPGSVYSIYDENHTHIKAPQIAAFRNAIAAELPPVQRLLRFGPRRAV